MAEILQCVEGQQREAINGESIIYYMRSTGKMMDANVHLLNRELWAFLNLNIIGNVRTRFDNAPACEGFEAWRRIVTPLGPRTEGKRHLLHGEVDSPRRATRLPELEMHME